MDKKIGKAVRAVISDAAKAALNAGKGARAIGTSGEIALGNKYVILSVDFREELFPPRDMSDEEFRGLTDEEKRVQGRLQNWFTFMTNNGALSFGAVLGATEMYSQEFWTAAKDKTDEECGIIKSEDFDVTKIFRPSARTAEAFIANDCDGLIGKTLRVVGLKAYQRGDFPAKARAFVVE